MKLVKLITKFGNKITSIGEKYNFRPFIYNPIVWLRFLYQSRYCGRIFAGIIKSEFPNIKSSLDVGSGGAGYVYHMKKLGFLAAGVEFSVVGRILGLAQGLNIDKFDCSKTDSLSDIKKKYDLVYSIEVGEHIPIQFSDSYIDYITKRGSIVVFSAAHPGQGGHGHINEQPKEYWLEKFIRRNFSYDDLLTQKIKEKLLADGYKGWLPYNLMVFLKTHH